LVVEDFFKVSFFGLSSAETVKIVMLRKNKDNNDIVKNFEVLMFVNN
jgi:hypothetical protein